VRNIIEKKGKVKENIFLNPQISQTRLPPARNASQREAGGLQGTSGQVTRIILII